MPKKPSKKPKTTKKSRPVSKRHNLPRIVLIGITAIIIVLAGCYLYVDGLVQKALSRSNQSDSAQILSRPEPLTDYLLEKPASYTLVLNNRNYTAPGKEPAIPGEYFKNDSALKIFIREFQDSNGNSHSARLLNISLDKQGNEALLEPRPLGTLGQGETRTALHKNLNEIPVNVINAILAIEDERFYKHFGLDILGILRATATNLSHLSFVQGGSTLTQQLAKNILFSPKKTLVRKFKEALAAISLETRLSKEKILEMYVNEIYLGQQGSSEIHGLAAAAKFFFNKDIKSLSLAESATLAGIIKAPSYYSPTRNPDRALSRRDVVLGKMYELSFISEKNYKSALKSPLGAIKAKILSRASFFVEAVRRDLRNSFDLAALDQPGIKINTGLSYEMQNCAEHAIRLGLDNLEKTYKSVARKSNRLEAALLAIEPYSGFVRAWVGGRDYRETQFDHINQARRQIGSTIKPFVYLTALDPQLNSYRAATPSTILPDEPLKIKVPYQDDFWSPENYDHEYRGEVTLTYALEHSLNVPAAYIGQKVGPSKIAETLKLYRLSKNPLPVPALALGAIEASLLDVTAAYAALANGGLYIKPRLYSTITDYDGVIISATKADEERVSAEAPVFVLTNIMQGVVERGTAASIRANGYTHPAAGKTGTTNDARDAWFIGFNPSITAGVWVGFDDNSKIGLSGSQAAAPIWAEFMKCTAELEKPTEFIAPPGVISAQIDSKTGRRYSTECDGQPIQEIFVSGTEPLLTCGETELPEIRPKQQTSDKPKQKSLWEKLFG